MVGETLAKQTQTLPVCLSLRVKAPIYASNRASFPPRVWLHAEYLLDGRGGGGGKVPFEAGPGLVKRHLRWTPVNTEVFIVGKYRRTDNPHPDAKFFDVNSRRRGEKARRTAAEAAIADILVWFKDKNNKVATLDATNFTKS
ncbi:uncharacterized protein PV07_08639 [Cladophialophora immunda]|uniref:6-phosphofructo-2-kinase domain-containing protein n=1 Tax=Cladophialophora immunda TaxID=569365 RepID=A0A0D2C2L7_9EURO|nr:uncharacterized protein PV07_08639 [Cladophialophora immunda]KIW25473.1 hypothetical protein PV07_08639 [Cladophialophora immunda]